MDKKQLLLLFLIDSITDLEFNISSIISDIFYSLLVEKLTCKKNLSNKTVALIILIKLTIDFYLSEADHFSLIKCLKKIVIDKIILNITLNN